MSLFYSNTAFNGGKNGGSATGESHETAKSSLIVKPINKNMSIINEMFKLDVWHNGEKINAECMVENGETYAWIDDDLKTIFRCSRCGKLHTEDDFWKNSSTKNGLSPWCKTCTNEYNKERRAKKTASPMIDNEETTDPTGESENTIEMDVESLWVDFKERLTKKLTPQNNASESEICRMSNMIEELERENKELREKNDKLYKESIAPITVNDLNEKLVLDYLKKHEVSIRVLIEAITAHDNGIVITVFDSNTGLTRTVKYETPKAA